MLSLRQEFPCLAIRQGLCGYKIYTVHQVVKGRSRDVFVGEGVLRLVLGLWVGCLTADDKDVDADGDEGKTDPLVYGECE